MDHQHHSNNGLSSHAFKLCAAKVHCSTGSSCLQCKNAPVQVTWLLVCCTLRKTGFNSPLHDTAAKVHGPTPSRGSLKPVSNLCNPQHPGSGSTRALAGQTSTTQHHEHPQRHKPSLSGTKHVTKQLRPGVSQTHPQQVSITVHITHAQQS